jgi:hypothetical protein
MPIDFARVPPRVTVPELPQPSKLGWAALLILVMCMGAALMIFLWPAGRPTNTAWFWFCVLGYPTLMWAFLLCCRFGYAHVQRAGAMATNRVSESEGQKCHELASVPLAVLGHAWRFSCNAQENGIEGLVNGSVTMSTRPSKAEPRIDVNARWFEIPGKPFYAGNELDEHARHRVVCDWLLDRLINDLSAGLSALPARTALHVDLCVQSACELAYVHARLQELMSAKRPALRVTVKTNREHSSLFKADAWHDNATPNEAYLFIAIQLRNAISERLQDGTAETGIALLLSHPDVARKILPPRISLSLHRPAIGPADAVSQTLELAARWGRADSTQIKTVWSHALSGELMRLVKSSPSFGEHKQWIDLSATVGICDGAGAWLATALAAEHASLTDDPQFVLTQEGNDLIALVCRKQI